MPLGSETGVEKPSLAYREEILWAAGFFEGEGTVALRSVMVAQVDLWPLERLLNTFGGSIGTKPREGKGKRQPCWQWFICGEQGRLFVELIYPHLSPRRRKQIDDKFITHEKRVRMRASIKEAYKELTKLRGRNEDGRFNHATVS